MIESDIRGRIGSCQAKTKLDKDRVRSYTADPSFYHPRTEASSP